MKKLLLYFFLLFPPCCADAQDQDTGQLQRTAHAFIRQGDYANAVLVLNRALQKDPENIALLKTLALAYYYQKDNTKALETIKPLLENNDCDDQCFQIAGNIYKELDMLKECERMYKKGIKKFPKSGALNNDLGELYWAQKNYEAIRQWEKGIEADPSFSKNYYNATRFYYLTKDKIWSVLYGEIFINMEPLSRNTPEIKDILLDSYKKLFSDANLEEDDKDKSSFEKLFLQSMNRQSAVALQGINTETLTMIRTRFVLDWANNYKNKYPYKLFEYHQQLLQEGLFDAYNQWLFGSSENLTRFQSWTVIHADDYKAFMNFQKGRIFKMREGEGYK